MGKKGIARRNFKKQQKLQKNNPVKSLFKSKDDKTKVIKELVNKYDESEKLYNICVNDGCEDVVDPQNWLHNQDQMIDNWQKFKIICESQGPSGDILLNNSFGKYMNHMCESYPLEFGNKVRENYNNKIQSDGAEIYYELMTQQNKPTILESNDQNGILNMVYTDC